MNFAIFEDCLNINEPASYFFSDPISEVKIYYPEEFNAGLAQIEQLSQQGFYLAGYIAYTAANAIYPQLKLNHDQEQPILYFVAYRSVEYFASRDLLQIISNHLPDHLNHSINSNNNLDDKPQPLFNYVELAHNYEEYHKQFEQVQAQLKLGNSYQINLTMQLHLDSNCNDLFQLYYTLSRSHPVSYASYLPFAPQSVISISPELFFKKTDHTIQVKPMKGTMPRGINPEQDLYYHNYLQNDAKNQAENLIIVDLLRNDLAKFCIHGSITVPKLFDIEPFKSLYQMTSTIEGTLDSTTTFSQIIHGLFPCGSISGAPKLSTLQLIEQIESHPRGIYTGAIGYILPNNDMQFNVAIRTLCAPINNPRQLSMGIGGGITVQAKAQEEWHEISSKLGFIQNFYQAQFNLIESFLVTDGIIHNLEQHLKRLQSSAEKLGFNHQITKTTSNTATTIGLVVTNYCQKHCVIGKQYKLRLELMQNRQFNLEHSEIISHQKSLTVALLPINLDTRHGLFKHKTTSHHVRELYDSLIKDYKPLHIDELIFMNLAGVITESRYYNVIIDYHGQLITTPVNAGLLGGIYRESLLQANQLIEQEINQAMLNEAGAIYLCNDVRGLIPCKLVSIGS